jgi:hypothetical protein
VCEKAKSAMPADPQRSSPDFEAGGLLDGVDGRARAARLHLLERWHAAGVGLAELKRAIAENRLLILSAEHALGSEVRYSSR